MLSDEEKKAIKEVKHFKELTRYWQEEEYEEKEIAGYIGIILNLIEKQSKEIEELKEYKHDSELTKVACCTAQNCEALNNCIKLERELQNADKKWEDKIKAKIEEYLEYDKKYKRHMKDGRECFTMEYYYAKMLQSLLEKE